MREEGRGDRTRRYRTPTSPARFNFRTKKDGTVQGAFWGRVKLADGSSPFFSEEYFAIQRTAEITVTDLTGTALRKSMTNADGEFVVVDVPAAQLRTTARLDGVRAGLVTPTATIASGDPAPLSITNNRI